MTIQMYSDINTLYRQLYDILRKLRTMVRDQATMAPDASNVPERALGVKRANMPDTDDYADKLEAMTVCQSLEFGLNQLHEAACALYIRHKYNQIVVDYFVGDEHMGSERKLPLKERMTTSEKEVQKLSAMPRRQSVSRVAPSTAKGQAEEEDAVVSSRQRKGDPCLRVPQRTPLPRKAGGQPTSRSPRPR